MPSQQAPVRVFKPRTQMPILMHREREVVLSAHLVDHPTAQMEVREMDGEEAENSWLDSVFTEEFARAFPDSAIEPIYLDAIPPGSRVA